MKRWMFIVGLNVLVMMFLLVVLSELQKTDERLALLFLVLGMDGALVSVLFSKSLAEWMAKRIPLPGMGSAGGKVFWSVLSGLMVFSAFFLGLTGVFLKVVGGTGRGGDALSIIALFNVMVVFAGLAGAFLLVRKVWGKWRKSDL